MLSSTIEGNMSDPYEIASTTQKFLDIFDITNDVVVLKDGTVTLIMMVSAMNFGLLAEQEQDAIIYAYAALLNSLNFPVQIIISSKTKDATAYLRLLDTQADKASSQEKRALIKRYQLFVGQLIKERNVLDKKFYVAIPASPAEVGMVTVQTVLPGKTTPSLTKEQKAAVIEKGLGVLEPRRDHLIAQFNRIGLYAHQISTQEIIEFFYNSYNPEAYEGQQITDSQDYTTMTVQAQTSGSGPDLSSLTLPHQEKTLDEVKLESAQEQDSAHLSQSAVVPTNIGDVVDSMAAPTPQAVSQTPAAAPSPTTTSPVPASSITLEKPVLSENIPSTPMNQPLNQPLPHASETPVFSASQPAPTQPTPTSQTVFSAPPEKPLPPVAEL